MGLANKESHVSDAADPSVNGSSGSGAVNASNATGGVTADLKNEIQKIVMGIFREQVPRAVKAAIGDALPDALRGLDLGTQDKPEKATSGNTADSDKTTQKARIEALERQLQDFQKQAKDAEARAKDSMLRARVQQEIAKYLPASDPNHDAYLGKLYDLDKRFGDGESGAFVKFKRDWGEEPVPLEQGVKELFEGQLRHLVKQPSKADSLPPGRHRVTGQPMTNGKPAPRTNPLDEMLSQVAASALRNGAAEE